MELRFAQPGELAMAMELINMGKRYLKQQGVDQWQDGYPDESRIALDIERKKGFFAVEDGEILGYLCVDYDGEPAYDHLNGQWAEEGPYVVVHRMAFSDEARGKGVSSKVFRLVEDMSAARGIRLFRIDTDEDNLRMRHVLSKNGFQYRGTIWFQNSVKIAFDKTIG